MPEATRFSPVQGYCANSPAAHPPMRRVGAGCRGPSWHLGGVLTGPPALARNSDGRLELFVQGGADRPYHIWQLAPSGAWSPWTAFDGAVKSLSVVSNLDGRLELFGRGTDQALHHTWQIMRSGA